MPALPPALQDRLLRLFLESRAELAAVAEATGLTLLQLVAWFRQPDTQADLAAIRDMAKARAEILADLNLPAAVENLNCVNERLARLELDSRAPAPVILRLADTVRRNAGAMQRLGSPRTPARARIASIPAEPSPAPAESAQHPARAEELAGDRITPLIPPSDRIEPAVETSNSDAAPPSTARTRDQPALAAAA